MNINKKNNLYLFILILLSFAIHAEEIMPEGFDDISTEENAPIDLYYHDHYLGSFIATFDDDYFYFDTPKEVLNKLAFVEQPKIIMQELGKKLNPNVDLACNDLDKKKCTFITPDVIGIILDRSKYKVYLYLNYKYLKAAEQAELMYLNNSSVPFGISIKNSLFTKSIYDQDTETKITTFNLNGEATLSKGNFELDLETIMSFGFNQKMESQKLPPFKLNNYLGKYRRKKYLTSIGTFNTYGSFLIPSQNALGVMIETDKTLLVNPDIKYGTPVQVNINDPSVVEVKRENTIIYSKFYPPGNYFIDTKSFPSGVYNIQVIISSLYGKSKTFNKIFIKKNDYPAMGEYLYSVGIGFLPNLEEVGDSILPTYHKDRGVVSGSYAKRLTRQMSVNGSIISDIDYTALSVGLSRFGSIHQIDIAGLIANDKGFGCSVSANLNLFGLSINSLVRYIHDEHSNISNSDIVKTTPLDLLKESFINYNFIASYSFMKNSISMSYNYINYYSDIKPIEYEFSANYSRPLVNKMGVNSTISLNYIKNYTGYSLLAGINMQISGKSIDQTINLLVDKSVSDDVYKQNLNYTIKYRINEDLNLSATANAKREPSPTIKKFNKQIESSYLGGIAYNPYNLQAQVLANHLPDHSYGYFYNLSVTSNWGGVYSYKNGITWTKRMLYDSGVFIKIKAPSDNAKFNVSFDDEDSRTIDANSNYFFALSPYKIHKIQVISGDEDSFYKIEGLPDKIFLYPGNIYPVQLIAKEFFVLMTVLVNEQGEPIQNATINLGAEFDNNSDEFGEIQIDVSQGDKIKVTHGENNRTCYFIVPNGEAEGGILMIDQVVCK